MKKIIFTSLLILFVLIYFLFFSGQTFLAPLSTIYSKGFSYEKFYKIQIGTSQAEVNKILGEPFIKRGGNQEGCDWYSGNTTSWGLSDWWGWVSVRVCYDKEGKVREIIRDVFFN